jgi:hypothetical protein
MLSLSPALTGIHPSLKQALSQGSMDARVKSAHDDPVNYAAATFRRA